MKHGRFEFKGRTLIGKVIRRQHEDMLEVKVGLQEYEVPTENFEYLKIGRPFEETPRSAKVEAKITVAEKAALDALVKLQGPKIRERLKAKTRSDVIREAILAHLDRAHVKVEP